MIGVKTTPAVQQVTVNVPAKYQHPEAAAANLERIAGQLTEEQLAKLARLKQTNPAKFAIAIANL